MQILSSKTWFLKEKRENEKKEREKNIIQRKKEWRLKREEEAKRKAENAKKREEKQDGARFIMEEEKCRKENKVKKKFVGFFVKKENNPSERNEEKRTSRFMPFQTNEKMKIAPICRRVDFVNMTQAERQEYFCKFDEIIYIKNTKEVVFYIYF